jgi:hypothetical protein
MFQSTLKIISRSNVEFISFGAEQDVDKVHSFKIQKASHFCEAFKVEDNGLEPIAFPNAFGTL